MTVKVLKSIPTTPLKKSATADKASKKSSKKILEEAKKSDRKTRVPVSHTVEAKVADGMDSPSETLPEANRFLLRALESQTSDDLAPDSGLSVAQVKSIHAELKRIATLPEQSVYLIQYIKYFSPAGSSSQKGYLQLSVRRADLDKLAHALGKLGATPSESYADAKVMQLGPLQIELRGSLSKNELESLMASAADTPAGKVAGDLVKSLQVLDPKDFSDPKAGPLDELEKVSLEGNRLVFYAKSGSCTEASPLAISPRSKAEERVPEAQSRKPRWLKELSYAARKLLWSGVMYTGVVAPPLTLVGTVTGAAMGAFGWWVPAVATLGSVVVGFVAVMNGAWNHDHLD